MKFVGTNEGHTLFFFMKVWDNGKLLNNWLFDPFFRMIRPGTVVCNPVARPVATLEVLYSDEQLLTCLLPSVVAKDLVSAIAKDKSPGNTVKNVEHFFKYRGFKQSMPMLWKVKSRYKTYDGLSGLVD